MIEEIDLLNKPNSQFFLFSFLFVAAYLFLRKDVLIAGLLLAIIIYLNRQYLVDNLNTNIDDKRVQLKRDDGVKKTSLVQSNDINNIYKRLKSFRRYNHTSYRRGVKLWDMFQAEIQELVRPDLSLGHKIFENAHYYLMRSIASFDEIQLSIPEQGLNASLKNDKNTSLRLKSELSDLTQELYRLGYRILFPISQNLNTTFYQKPNIFMNHVAIDNSYTKASNEIDHHTLYI